MTIKQFIEKAIEGGWRKDLGETYKELSYEDSKPISEHILNQLKIPIERILLDPLAWKSVGKVEGWNGQNKGDGRETLCSWKHTWIENMHAMIDALTEGRSLEEYIKTL